MQESITAAEMLIVKYDVYGTRMPNEVNQCEHAHATPMMEITPVGTNGLLNESSTYLRYGPSAYAEEVTSIWSQMQSVDFYEPSFGDCGAAGGPSCYIGARHSRKSLR